MTMKSTLLFCSILCVCCFVNSAYGNYASILTEQLDLYCSSRNTIASTPHVLRVSKAGPRGPPGRIGSPGIVNYTTVQHILTSNLQELKLEEKIVNLTKRLALLEEEGAKSSRTDCTHATRENAKIQNETGGVFDIYLGKSKRKLETYCDTTTDGGGWMVIQRRMDGSENFFRNWADYVDGFGQPQGEYWIGLENLYRITTQDQVEMRVDIEDWEGNKAYAKYTLFSVGNAGTKYTLRIGGYSGTAGDALIQHNNQPFSTKDQDNDSSSAHSANVYQSAWWFRSGYYSNLNGIYFKGGKYTNNQPTGVEWHSWRKKHYYSLKFVEMNIRPIN